MEGFDPEHPLEMWCEKLGGSSVGKGNGAYLWSNNNAAWCVLCVFGGANNGAYAGFAWNEKPTDVFTYIIPTAGGVFAAAVVWYLKAVQLENGIKIQLGMIKKLIDLGEENQAEETKERIIQKMKDKTDTIIDEALEPTEIQNF